MKPYTLCAMTLHLNTILSFTEAQEVALTETQRHHLMLPPPQCKISYTNIFANKDGPRAKPWPLMPTAIKEVQIHGILTEPRCISK